MQPAINKLSPASLFPMRLDLDAITESHYQFAIDELQKANIAFLVGGAFALGAYTGIVRHTKDLDLFVRPVDCLKIVSLMRQLGFQAEIVDSVWLGKIYFPNGSFIDLIFRSGNSQCEVTDEWFQDPQVAEVIGREVLICQPEDNIWSKSYIMERERYDGADVIHLLRVCSSYLDWDRLLRRFGNHWRLLLHYLVLFGFIYPDETDLIPQWVMNALVQRLQPPDQSLAPIEKTCRGTLLSRHFYMVDVEGWNYADARTGNSTTLSPPETLEWKKNLHNRKLEFQEVTKILEVKRPAL